MTAIAEEIPRPTAPPGVRLIALAGNPNCGKSTIFNALTGLRQKVGNYPGVTVEKKTGRFNALHGEPMEALDLPGSYSLQSRSPDEAVSRDILLGRRTETRRPDAVLSVVDASNLDRNLYLTSQLLELGLPVIVALNMIDVAEAKGIHIDVEALGQKLGVPVIPMVASKGVGLVELKAALSKNRLSPPLVKPALPDALVGETVALAERLATTSPSPDSEALLLLSTEGEAAMLAAARDPSIAAEALGAQSRLRAAGVDPASTAAESRYLWIHSVCAGTVHRPGETGWTLSDRIDAVLTHRIWGWVAFLAIMATVFYSIFAVASWPMEWIETLTATAGQWLGNHLPEGQLRSLLADGVVAGVGGVVIFLPQILILFFFLGILEDSGYMARAAFIMDRLMARVGLHGKSFIPLLSSFACAIPGVMATRTIENRNDRLATILVAPFMSCSARLPVYTLMIAILLPAGAGGPWTRAGIMLSMYLLGILAAFGVAWIFKRTLFRGEKPMLLLEMPPYRMPSPRTIALRMWERALIFLTRAGTVILAISIVLWALASFPKPSDPGTSPSAALAQSYAGQLGHAIEPALRPLGFDWKIGIGLVASFAAREVFVGTMAIVYNVGDDAGGDGGKVETLSDVMLSQKRPDGSPVYTPLVCIGIMVFYVLAMQCMSTLAVVRRETNSWRWPAFQFAYMGALAYAATLLVYQIGLLLGFR